MARYVDIECDAVTEVLPRRAFKTRQDIQGFLDNIPTVDVTPVRRGRWIERKEHFYFQNGCKEWINFYCSECDAPNNSPTDYCPNCGAKMSGGKKDG